MKKSKLFIATLLIGVMLAFAGCNYKTETQLPECVEMSYINSTIKITAINEINMKFFWDLYDTIEYALKNNVKTLELNFLSPGGIIPCMFASYDLLMEAKKEGLEIITHGYGLVASAAVVVYLTGDIRTLDENGYIMIHPHTGSINPFLQGNINKTYIEWTNKYADILVTRTKITLSEAIEMLTGDVKYKANYFNSVESLNAGLITHIRVQD